MYTARYYRDVLREDLPKLGTEDRNRVETAIKQKLLTSPETFGIPLRHSLKGLRKLRVGDYRVIFQIIGQEVHISAILHRSVVYKIAPTRT